MNVPNPAPNPTEGGSYTRNPETGELTRVRHPDESRGPPPTEAPPQAPIKWAPASAGVTATPKE